MPSILSGYEYDIFISYRQNDNKRDKWVTQFVEALKDELEATLKNPVSIYFDENPHDGLLETHQVNASLKKKLKCLIFIPIISQTYCDPNCFAWEHEFIPFNKMAKEDELGMNVTLANGNVTSRVLPVQIHKLDDEDQSTLEKELGGPLRSIKFIHQSAGVNRSLTKQDDQVRASGKILYSDQINKVANALKEIGTSLLRNSSNKTGRLDESGVEVVKTTGLSTSAKSKVSFKMIAVGFIIIAAIVFASYTYSVYSEQKLVPTITEKSITILPFEDMSPDKDQEWFSAGLTEELNNTLARVPDLIVRARTSSANFQGKNLSIKKIGDSLHVAYILQGSIRKMGKELKISTQLVQASTGTILWSNTYNKTMNDIFLIQEDISENIAEALDIMLDDKKRSRMYSVGTKNVDAYEEYLKGDAFYKKAHVFSTIDSSLLKANIHFEKAIALDPSFSQGYARHQDYYAHYFLEGKQGVYKYALAEYTNNEIIEIISNDMYAAVKNCKQPVFKIGYQLDKIFLSDNWQEAPTLVNTFINLSEEDQLLIINEFSWFTHIFSYEAPGFFNYLYLKRIENDPYDYTAYNLFFSSLIRMNLLDSAASFFDNNKRYIQKIPRLASKRTSIALMKGNFEEANEISKKAFLNRKELQLNNHYFILSKILVEDNTGLSDGSNYFSQQGLNALPYYNITGQYQKADSLAHAFDSQFLGPCIISANLFSNPLFFHLSATPNFSARLSELGIDPNQYEADHYIKLPMVSLKKLNIASRVID